MRKILSVWLLLAAACGVSHAVPAVVHASLCPNSRDAGHSLAGEFYQCPLVDPTISGNTLIVWFPFDNTGNNQVWTVKDSASNSLTNDGGSGNSPNGNEGNVYRESNVASGLTYIKITNTSGGSQGFMQPLILEISGVTTTSPLDHLWCGTGTNTAQSAGASGTLSTSGDIILQFSYPDTLTSQTSNWTNGSGFTLLANNYYDGYAAQYQVYNSTATITPILTAGTSAAYITCAAAYKAGTSGGPETGVFPISTEHDNDPAGSRVASPWTAGVVSHGNALLASVLSFNGTQISSITSSPSCPGSGWVALGAASSNASIAQIWWCPNSSFNGPVKITYNLTANTFNDTFMVYDLSSSGTWSTDVVQNETGNQTTGMTSITTCTSCITPSGANELVFGVAGWNNCTGTGVTSPSGAMFDTAWGTITSVNGPQPVDENNLWWHLSNAPATAITNTATILCDGTNPPDEWAAQFAAVKPLTVASTTPAHSGIF